MGVYNITVSYLAGTGSYVYYDSEYSTYWTNDDDNFLSGSMTEYYDVECKCLTGRYGVQTACTDDFAYITIVENN